MIRPNWEVEVYAALIDKILKTGEKRNTRNGNTYALFGESFTIDAERDFPILQGRRMYYKPVLGELAAMLRGPKHVDDFKQYGCNYWDSWGDGNGAIEVDYGNAWLDFNGVDQLAELVNGLKSDPMGRRHIVTGWRPDRLKKLSLPCCHMLYQWFVRDGKFLDMIWYQRSVDTMIGLPSDIILAAAWNAVLGSQVDLIPGRITFFLGDTHIYENHLVPTLDYLRNLQYTKFRPIAYGVDDEATLQNFDPNHLQIDYNDALMKSIGFKLNV